MAAVQEVASTVGVRPACEALAVSRATYYRWQRPECAVAAPAARRTSARALSQGEREQVLSTLDCERFVDAAPRQVYAALLDEGTYLCSVRTMYRILAAAGEVGERRNQLRRPAYEKPELLATGPNQVWSWDITKLKGPVKWTYYYLYVILDIFSRYVVGWMLAHRESRSLARRLIADTLAKQQVAPGQLILHADRGPAMTSQPVAHLLAELGVTRSHSRPHTSNDNPYSEAQFKTLKYQPAFPERFGCFQDARTFLESFFTAYNEGHYHTGLGLLTPACVHYGTAQQVLAQRQQVLDQAFQAHPERFRGRAPQPQKPPPAVWINPPTPHLEIQNPNGPSEGTDGEGRIDAPQGLSRPESPQREAATPKLSYPGRLADVANDRPAQPTHPYPAIFCGGPFS